MRFAQLGATAALAGVSQAFLIPSTISSAKTNDAFTLPFDIKALTAERVVEVNCPGCPVQTLDKGVMHWGHTESILRLNFTVVRGDTDKLMMNELQIYPINPRISALTTTLKADQLIKVDNSWAYSSSPALGYGLRMRHPFNRGTEAKTGLSLVSFHVEIVEVANKFVPTIPAVNLYLVETKSGQLMIGPTNIEHKNLVAVAATSKSAPHCTTLLCKWKAILAAKAAGLKKGCGRKGRPYRISSPYVINGGPNKFPHHRPHGSFTHGHRRPHQSAVGKLLRSVTFHILLPIFIGIVIGVLASLIGMVVGHIAIFFWRLLFRRGERGQYCRVKQQESSNESDEETKGFLENQGPPPVYEDTVAVEEEKTEQK